eukprot:TRINITY_DN5295_c0_g1_i2.p1 TRINITY_DN5295_c0_g1~~TRINITY_DN5295_c0_g1_i2.p1  ORF type:complete len:191 (-),score=44.78 TRINITY_DN5295_c0_g1_i2:22-594(-)
MFSLCLAQYHRGFRHQVANWPVNPLDIMISQLRSHPEWVIADLGCGEGRLGATLTGHKVHSFDLVALSPHVTVADIASLPLPNASVDVAVFCLSLMGTNLVDFLTEAHRILKPNGLLKIAEVVSRFPDDDIRGSYAPFSSKLAALGFAPVSQDASNRVFVLFDFRKVNVVSKKKVKNVGVMLKPCLYKKR